MKKKRLWYGPMMTVGGVWVIDDEYYMLKLWGPIKREIIASVWSDPTDRC